MEGAVVDCPADCVAVDCPAVSVACAVVGFIVTDCPVVEVAMKCIQSTIIKFLSIILRYSCGQIKKECIVNIACTGSNKYTPPPHMQNNRIENNQFTSGVILYIKIFVRQYIKIKNNTIRLGCINIGNYWRQRGWLNYGTISS